MNAVFQMAIKDLRLIFRDRMGLFFIAIFPIIMGLFFGVVMSQGGSTDGGSGSMRIAVIDQDQSPASIQFSESLAALEQLDIQDLELDAAKDRVRKGSLIGLVVLPKGFGDRAGVLWNEPPTIRLGLYESRTAEAAMLQGFIMQAIGEIVAQRFQDPESMRPFLDQAKEDLAQNSANPIQAGLLRAFLDSVDTMIESAAEVQESDDGSTGMAGTEFVTIEDELIFGEVDENSIEGQLQKTKSRWDVSFPQAMLWGVLACVAGFAISIARERSMGTLVRLQIAPINRNSILLGKALACFLMVLAVLSLLTLLGWMLGLKLGSHNLPQLVFVSLCVAFCFVGIMMVMSVMGKTEQAVSGAGWGVNMVMAMLGGCMIPAMFLPGFLKKVSFLSPVRWAIQGIEGAIWREFTWGELMVPCGIMIAIGTVALVVGSLILNRQLKNA